MVDLLIFNIYLGWFLLADQLFSLANWLTNDFADPANTVYYQFDWLCFLRLPDW